MTTAPLLQLPNTYRAFYGAFATLRPFQRDVITPSLQRPDVIVQAATGRGKTAAVRAPCLERILAYLVQRLERHGNRRLQKIALSATLAGPEAIQAALGLHPGTVYVHSVVQRQIQPHLVHLQREQDELIALIDDLVQRFGYRKLL